MIAHEVVKAAPFLPQTLGSYAAVFGAIAAGVASVGTWLNRKRIQEVHVLVNSNLQDVKRQLSAVTGERNALQEDTGLAEPRPVVLPSKVHVVVEDASGETPAP